MHVPDGFRLVQDGDSSAIVRADLAHLPLACWWARGEPLLDAPGRGTVTLLEPTHGMRAIGRDYRRGGFSRHLLPDRFLDRSRPRRELEVLLSLQRRGVPVVDPLAALARGRGMLWQLRLVTRLVEGARSLPAFVASRPGQARRTVKEAGRIIAQAFEAGLLHPDLHPDNLIVSTCGGAPRVFLLDLDRAVVRPALRGRERDRMLLRMARYLERHADSLPCRFRLVDRLRFLAGMGLLRETRRAEMRRLVPLYERVVARHRLGWRLPGAGR